MIGFGLLCAILCAFAKAIDVLINKSVMQQQTAVQHCLLRIAFVTPVLLVAALMNWKLEKGVLGYVLLYGVLEAVNIFCHQTAVKRSEPLHIELVSKSKIFFVLIVSFVLGIDRLTPASTLGIAVFMAGTVLTVNFQDRTGRDQTDLVGILLETASVLARTFKPFVLKSCVQKGLTTNETMAFLSMFVAFGILAAAFRPKLQLKTVSVKKYLGQAVIVGVGMLLGGWAVIHANAVIVNAIEGTTVFFVMGLSWLLLKKKYNWLTVVGSLIAVSGIVLSIVL